MMQLFDVSRQLWDWNWTRPFFLPTQQQREKKWSSRKTKQAPCCLIDDVRGTVVTVHYISSGYRHIQGNIGYLQLQLFQLKHPLKEYALDVQAF